MPIALTVYEHPCNSSYWTGEQKKVRNLEMPGSFPDRDERA